MNDNFDWKYYIKKYPDLREKGIITKSRAIRHYFTYGKKENRFPNIIEENKFYRQNNAKFIKTDNNDTSDEINSKIDVIFEQLNDLIDVVYELKNNFDNKFQVLDKNINNFMEINDSVDLVKKKNKKKDTHKPENKNSKLNNDDNSFSDEYPKNIVLKDVINVESFDVTPNNIAPKNSSKIESSEEYELNLSQHFNESIEINKDKNEDFIDYSNSNEMSENKESNLFVKKSTSSDDSDSDNINSQGIDSVDSKSPYKSPEDLFIDTN